MGEATVGIIGKILKWFEDQKRVEEEGLRWLGRTTEKMYLIEVKGPILAFPSYNPRGPAYFLSVDGFHFHEVPHRPRIFTRDLAIYIGDSGRGVSLTRVMEWPSRPMEVCPVPDLPVAYKPLSE
jgi:hypothetical protein